MKWKEVLWQWKEVLIAVVGLLVIIFQITIMVVTLDVDRVIHKNAAILEQNTKTAQSLAERATNLEHIDTVMNSSLNNGKRIADLAKEMDELLRELDEHAEKSHIERQKVIDEVEGFGTELREHVAGGRKFLESIRNAAVQSSTSSASPSPSSSPQ